MLSVLLTSIKRLYLSTFGVAEGVTVSFSDQNTIEMEYDTWIGLGRPSPILLDPVMAEVLHKILRRRTHGGDGLSVILSPSPVRDDDGSFFGCVRRCGFEASRKTGTTSSATIGK